MELLLTLGGKEFLIRDSIFNLVFVVIILAIFAIVVGKKLKNVDPNNVPTGFFNVLEIIVETSNKLVKQTMGAKNMRFAPYIFTLFMFLAVANLLGLVGLTPPTSDYSVTLSLALVTFTITQILSFRTQKGLLGYMKGFTEPFAVLTPINILGEVANPISLSFRLFGNVMSGGIILTLVYAALGFFAPIVTPLLHGYFDVFSGLLQTFIFGMLTMIFISDAT